MLNNRASFPTSKVNLFKNIILYAKNNDTEELSELINSGISVNFSLGLMTPIQQLAQENHKEAVNYLIDEFHANLNEAIIGYAKKNFTSSVNELITLGASKNLALYGYAAGHHFNEVDNLLAKGADPNFAAFGYARAGLFDKVDDCIRNGTDRDTIISYLALGGHTQKVNELIQLGANRNGAIVGYAYNGMIAEVTEQINLGASIYLAIAGYAKSGYITQVNELLPLVRDPLSAAIGYAKGGHILEVNKLADININETIRGYACGGHTDEVNRLIQKGALTAQAVKGYVDANLIDNKNLLRLLAYIDNEKLRSCLLDEANTNEYDKALLLKQSAKLNQLIKKDKLSFNQSTAYLQSSNWLLQGSQLVKNNTIPQEVYIHILTYLANCNITDAAKISNGCQNRLEERISNLKYRENLVDSNNSNPCETKGNIANTCKKDKHHPKHRLLNLFACFRKSTQEKNDMTTTNILSKNGTSYPTP